MKLNKQIIKLGIIAMIVAVLNTSAEACHGEAFGLGDYRNNYQKPGSWTTWRSY